MYKKHLDADFWYYFTNEQGLIMNRLYDSKTKRYKLAMTKYKKVATRWEQQLNDIKSGVFAVRF